MFDVFDTNGTIFRSSFPRWLVIKCVRTVRTAIGRHRCDMASAFIKLNFFFSLSLSLSLVSWSLFIYFVNGPGKKN